MRRHPTHAQFNPSHPMAWATCDRCGFNWQHDHLQWQFDWAGLQVINQRVMVCPYCRDKPQRQLGSIILPADPLPIMNARPEQYAMDENAGTPLVISGLSHYWPMDAVAVKGSTVTDVVGTLNGTATASGVSSINGPLHGFTGLAFDGTGSISLASSPVADFTQAHSVFCWAKVNNITAQGDGGVDQTFVSFALGSGDGCRIDMDNGANAPFIAGSLFINLVHGGVHSGVSSTVAAFANNTWGHVGYTWNGSTLTAYANGVAVSSAGDPGQTVGNNGAYTIGERSDGVGHLSGAMSQVTVFTRALAAADVAQLAVAVPAV